eukprot:1464181-Amphidinium_carterae.1
MPAPPTSQVTRQVPDDVRPEDSVSMVGAPSTVSAGGTRRRSLTNRSVDEYVEDIHAGRILN